MAVVLKPLPDDVIESLWICPQYLAIWMSMCRPCESMLGLPAYLVDC
jgi:hypothetical protein